MKLKEIMKSKNITQKDIEENTGITQATISNWVNNKKLGQIENLIKVCDYLNVSSDELLEIKKPSREITEEEELNNLWNELTVDEKKGIMTLLRDIYNVPRGNRTLDNLIKRPVNDLSINPTKIKEYWVKFINVTIQYFNNRHNMQISLCNLNVAMT